MPDWEVTERKTVANKILTFIIDTAEQELDTIIAAAVNEIHNLGHKTKEVRVADDSGEEKVALNTVAGVTPEAAGNPPAEPPTEPTAEETSPVEPTPPTEAAIPDPNAPAPADEPTDEPPVDTPPSDTTNTVQ